jgi:protein-S-isoprenylcysteine O-methyltransferase Ste14
MRFASSFWTAKTTWLSIATAATAIANAIQNHASPLSALMMVLAALFPAMLRDTVARGWESVTAALGALAGDGGEV